MSGASFLPRARMQSLIDVLCGRGYEVIGPRVEGGGIAFGPMTDAAKLPSGVRDTLAPGEARLRETGAARTFGWTLGAQGLRPWLFPARETLWRATRDDGRLRFEPLPLPMPCIAFLGARACDLAALELLDQAFLSGPEPDVAYRARREGLFVIAVNCTRAAPTCFCVSTGDGPRAARGYDLVLTELDDGFVADAGSERGQAVLGALNLSPARSAQIADADARVRTAADDQVRGLPGRDLRGALFARQEHARWDEVAARCVACGNCTQVCPTCFCHRHQTEGGALGGVSEQVREWDSCFSEGHGHLAGGHARPEIRHRYRQWLTHKLDGWHDQFGRSGCVGCGRCIAWCPVGIDLTEVARAILAD